MSRSPSPNKEVKDKQDLNETLPFDEDHLNNDQISEKIEKQEVTDSPDQKREINLMTNQELGIKTKRKKKGEIQVAQNLVTDGDFYSYKEEQEDEEYQTNIEDGDFSSIKKKVKSKGYTERKQKKLRKQQEIDTSCQDVISSIKLAYDKDMKCWEKGDPSFNLIIKYPEMKKVISRKNHMEVFLNYGGLDTYATILTPYPHPDNSLRLQNYREEIYKQIFEIDFEKKHLLKSKLPNLLLKLEKHPKEFKTNKKIIKKIVSKMQRLACNLETDYIHSEMYDSEKIIDHPVKKLLKVESIVGKQMKKMKQNDHKDSEFTTNHIRDLRKEIRHRGYCFTKRPKNNRYLGTLDEDIVSTTKISTLKFLQDQKLALRKKHSK